MTYSSKCRAKNKEFCRYHGTADSTTYQDRIEASYNSVTDAYQKANQLDERYELEQRLNAVQVEYAATDKGSTFFQTQLDEATDETEKDRYKEILEEGARFRASIEDKADGVINVLASRFEEAEKRIDTANRKLARAGLTERFTYTTEDYVETDKNGNMYQMKKLYLSHPTIQHEGWSFVATVDKTGDENSLITRTLPSQELNGYRPDKFQCDHCGSNRKRNSTYLLRNEEGEYKQVGSNCLEPFLGTKPKALWTLQYEPEEDDNLVDRGKRQPGGADSLMPTKDVVAAALLVSNNGDSYVSRSNAMEYGAPSTASNVLTYFYGKNSAWGNRDYKENLAAAEKIIAETKFDDTNDYATNMKTLLAQEYITPKHLGYVTSVVSAYKRQQEKAAKVTAPKSVGYLGKTGDKISNQFVTIKNIHHSTSVYNGVQIEKTLVVMTDEDNHEIKWWASGNKEYKTGDKLVLKSATIKDLDSFNGNDQTVVTRAKLLDI
jgi:hypothetical protein